MGRFSTGASTVNGAQRLELRWLINQGYIKCFGKNFELYGYHKQSIAWTNGNKINIEVHNYPNGMYLLLDYTITKRSGEQVYMNYKVHLCRKPANLGRGEVFYMVCPVSGNLCRILYREYGSHYFKSYKCYKKGLRLYYEAQQVSKKYLAFDQFRTKEEQLQKLVKKRDQERYKGKPTKRYLKTLQVEKQYNQLSDLTEKILMENLYRK